MITSRSVFLITRNVLRERCRENQNRVGYATTNDATMNECYNEQFLSIQSGSYNERGGILSADVSGLPVLIRASVIIYEG